MISIFCNRQLNWCIVQIHSVPLENLSDYWLQDLIVLVDKNKDMYIYLIPLLRKIWLWVLKNINKSSVNKIKYKKVVFQRNKNIMEYLLFSCRFRHWHPTVRLLLVLGWYIEKLYIFIVNVENILKSFIFIFDFTFKCKYIKNMEEYFYIYIDSILFSLHLVNLESIAEYFYFKEYNNLLVYLIIFYF